MATVAIALYSEGMARLHKSPVTIYLVVSFLPLVPGSKIYYTMEYGMAGDTARFLQTGLETCKIAGAIVAGIALVSVSYTHLAEEIRDRLINGYVPPETGSSTLNLSLIHIYCSISDTPLTARSKRA